MAFRAWLAAFIFTQIIEVPIYIRAFRCPWWAAFGASTLTHPVVSFLFLSPAWPGSYVAHIIPAELFAWLVEAAYFRFLFHRRFALRWSLVANAASYGVGLLSWWVFGGP